MVEHRLAKARAAGSNPVSCFFYLSGRSGENRTFGFFIYSEVLVRTKDLFYTGRLYGRKSVYLNLYEKLSICDHLGMCRKLKIFDIFNDNNDNEIEKGVHVPLKRKMYTFHAFIVCLLSSVSAMKRLP